MTCALASVWKLSHLQNCRFGCPCKHDDPPLVMFCVTRVPLLLRVFFPVAHLQPDVLASVWSQVHFEFCPWSSGCIASGSLGSFVPPSNHSLSVLPARSPWVPLSLPSPVHVPPRRSYLSIGPGDLPGGFESLPIGAIGGAGSQGDRRLSSCSDAIRFLTSRTSNSHHGCVRAASCVTNGRTCGWKGDGAVGGSAAVEAWAGVGRTAAVDVRGARSEHEKPRAWERYGDAS